MPDDQFEKKTQNYLTNLGYLLITLIITAICLAILIGVLSAFSWWIHLVLDWST